MSKNPTNEQFNSYVNIFNYLNETIFDSQLPNCILNFSRDNKNVYGFFAKKRWMKDKEFTHEISLNPRSLAILDSKEMIQTILHEMLHLWQNEFGNPSRPGYHNNEFAMKMESVGLMPSSTGEPGGNKTGQKMADYIIPRGKLERLIDDMPKEYILPWLCVEAEVKKYSEISGNVKNNIDTGNEILNEIIANPESIGMQKYDKKKRKYSCQECGINVWGKPDLNIICGECKIKLMCLT